MGTTASLNFHAPFGLSLSKPCAALHPLKAPLALTQRMLRFRPHQNFACSPTVTVRAAPGVTHTRLYELV
jgi:hypothetical protein